MTFTTFPQQRWSCVESESSPPSPPVKPRFSVFGKQTATLESDDTDLETMNNTRLNKKKRADTHWKPKQSTGRKIRFDPLFLERVCLFRQDEIVTELQPVDKPSLRLLCLHWPTNTELILVNRKDLTIENTVLKGQILVRNMSFDKSVTLHYALSGWSVRRDLDCVFFGPYLKNEQYDIYDFSMELELADHGEVRATLDFQVHYRVGHTDYTSPDYQCKIIADPLNYSAATAHLSKEEKEALETELYDHEPDHSTFHTALKEYQHAKFNLNKRPPWLGTRYDFSQSLSLAKRYPYDPDLPPSPTVELDSTDYHDLVDKYCFYTS